MFGTVFWDYSAIPFNLGGRINLLYCFFWGFAAIAWFKVLFPPISACIEKLPPRGGRVLTGHCASLWRRTLPSAPPRLCGTMTA